MKHLKNNAANCNYLLTVRNLSISFLAAALFFTSCEKDQLQYKDQPQVSTQMVPSEHSNLITTFTQLGTLEAESAVLSGAVLGTTNPNHTGVGYVHYTNKSGGYIEWTINATGAGTFSLQFRYANGGTTNCPLKLQVNGTNITTLAFTPTGGVATWSLSSASANLIAGANTVRLTTISSNGANVDNLSYSIGSIRHVLYMVDNGLNHLIFLNQKDPAKSWTISIPAGSRDLQLVANNKILVSHGNGAAEYDRTTGVKSWSNSNFIGVSSAQRLSNGHTMIGWSTAASGSTPAKVILSEVTSTGTEVARVTVNNITSFRLARRLSNGHTLITGDMSDGIWKVFEVDATGAIVWQLLLGGKGYVANRLSNGNTRATITHTDEKIIEYSPTGSIVKYWGGHADHPNGELRTFSGYSVVPGNGHFLQANWLGDGFIGNGPHLVEFDASNHMVYSWKDYTAAKTITNVLVIE
jgi:hypothetical protein